MIAIMAAIFLFFFSGQAEARDSGLTSIRSVVIESAAVDGKIVHGKTEAGRSPISISMNRDQQMLIRFKIKPVGGDTDRWDANLRIKRGDRWRSLRQDGAETRLHRESSNTWAGTPRIFGSVYFDPSELDADNEVELLSLFVEDVPTQIFRVHLGGILREQVSEGIEIVRSVEFGSWQWGPNGSHFVPGEFDSPESFTARITFRSAALLKHWLANEHAVLVCQKDGRVVAETEDFLTSSGNNDNSVYITVYTAGIRFPKWESGNPWCGPQTQDGRPALLLDIKFDGRNSPVVATATLPIKRRE